MTRLLACLVLSQDLYLITYTKVYKSAVLVRLDLLSLLGLSYSGFVLFLYLINPFNISLGVLLGYIDVIQDLDYVLRPVLIDAYPWLVA